MSYCAKCGGAKVKLNGEPCECSIGIHELYADVTCFDIPEQYRSISFNEELVPDTWGGSYRDCLKQLHTDISTTTLKGKNFVICSPPRRSKTIFAYSTMRRLFKSGIPVFPLYDVLELRNKYNLLDMGKKSDVEDEDLTLLNTVPYLFVRIPNVLSNDVFNIASFILDRRVRHGTSTIFLFNGTWERIVAADTYSAFTAYQGDGSYCSFSVKTWKEVNGI